MISPSSAIRPAAKRLIGGLDARHVAVMVGAHHVDHPVVAAAELVLVVADVGPEVGQLPGRAAQHAILVVAEGAGAQPRGALRRVHVSLLLQLCERALDLSALVGLALGEPAVEVNAKALQRGLDLLQHQLDRAARDRVQVVRPQALVLSRLASSPTYSPRYPPSGTSAPVIAAAIEAANSSTCVPWSLT